NSVRTRDHSQSPRTRPPGPPDLGHPGSASRAVLSEREPPSRNFGLNDLPDNGHVVCGLDHASWSGSWILDAMTDRHLDPVQGLIDTALAIDDEDDQGYWAAVQELQRRGDRATFEVMAELCKA